jgi:hypothetical protein
MVLCLLIAAVSTFNVFSQSRQDSPIAKWVIRSPKMTTANGYAFNPNTGKWITNKNAIYPNPVLPMIKSHVEQNFIWIQTAKITTGLETYIVLLVEKSSGRYKYPTSEVGWQQENRTYWYQFDSTQYANLNALVNGLGDEPIKMSLKYHDFITDYFTLLKGEHEYTDENLRASITNLDRSGYTLDCIKFQYVVDPKGDLVRFVLPYDECDQLNRTFEKEYFELPVAIFKAVLIKQ